VESFPILKHLPNFLALWKAEIQRRSREEAAVNVDLVPVVQHDILNAKTSESAFPSLCKHLLETRAADPHSFSLLCDRDSSFIPASLFEVDSDTTTSTLYSAFFALVTNSETLHAAHAELDAVTVHTELPLSTPKNSYRTSVAPAKRSFAGVLSPFWEAFLTSRPKWTRIKVSTSQRAPMFSATAGPLTSTRSITLTHIISTRSASSTSSQRHYRIKRRNACELRRLSRGSRTLASLDIARKYLRRCH